MFEIKFVEHEQPFYQLKKTYVYELRCELFRYEDEVIDTDISDIDDEIAQIGYIQTLNLIGAGTSATTAADMCSGAVNKIYISNMGRGFTGQPVLGFSHLPQQLEQRLSIASISKLHIPSNVMVSLVEYRQSISQIQVVDTLFHL